MRWYPEDVENAIRRAELKIAPVVDNVANELKVGKTDDLYVVGGFIRDNVLAELSGKQSNSKDLDLILSKQPDFNTNPNVIWKKENSFGGIKLGTKTFPVIDIFQSGISNLQIIVGEFFDFNCNALFYSHCQRRIAASAYFYGFIANRVINLENYIYTKDKIEQKYGVAPMISRALRFQIQFKEKFGIDTKLSSNILYLLYAIDKNTEQKMFEYTKAKVKSEILQARIIEEYNRLKYK